jgi:uncharacterized RDD family membrane protein YckC
MKARFRTDENAAPADPQTAELEPADIDSVDLDSTDLDSYDASEAQFAASLERPGARFVMEEATREKMIFAAPPRPAGDVSTHVEPEAADEAQAAPSPLPTPGNALAARDAEAWRREVADRVNQYRTRRRPREPRYPSLQLKFESSEPESTSPQIVASGMTSVAAVREENRKAQAAQKPVVEPVQAEPPARVIPFPRASAMPPRPLEELAEPVPSRPRILEAPEVAPPPPALGGILIEPESEPVVERRPGFEVPVQSAPFGRRILAAGADAVLELSAAALSGWIFLRLTSVALPLRLAALLAAGAAAVCWTGYQYLLLVHAGSTPGLLLARLRLARFDGSVAPKGLRRWRVLASILSAVSLGLGYAWCLLDEDQLCWHDRITRTYLAPKAGSRPS